MFSLVVFALFLLVFFGRQWSAVIRAVSLMKVPEHSAEKPGCRMRCLPMALYGSMVRWLGSMLSCLDKSRCCNSDEALACESRRKDRSGSRTTSTPLGRSTSGGNTTDSTMLLRRSSLGFSSWTRWRSRLYSIRDSSTFGGVDPVCRSSSGEVRLGPRHAEARSNMESSRMKAANMAADGAMLSGGRIRMMREPPVLNHKLRAFDCLSRDF